MKLYEPLKYYNEQGKKEHLEHTEKAFNELLEKSNIDVAGNRATVKSYEKEMATIKKIDEKLGRNKASKVLSIIGIVISALALIYGIIDVNVLAIVIPAVLIVGFSLLLGLVIIPNIKNAKKLKEKHQEKADKFYNEALSQMAPLNSLFDDNTPFKLIEKTIPELVFEDRFTKEHEQLFKTHHDFIDFQTEDSSMLDTISGKFMGNPFLFCRKRVHYMGSQTYHGSLTISWTESYRDSNGHYRTRVRTQTLHASIVRPKPFYNLNTYLLYGSQAAPDLTFSRQGEHADDLSERALERKIKKGEKKLKKKAEKALETGGRFQGMTNTEFDVLFNATNRDNEVQFRVMYTPLAQNNTVDLITDQVNYGDDFKFEKIKRLNVITSEHAQKWDMNVSASQYYSYSVDDAKNKFITFNQEFFKSVFFDFAPLMAVPAYLEEPCASLEEIEDYDTNYTYYEHEVMANAIGDNAFMHEDTVTPCILKTSYLGKDGSIDTINVTAKSFYSVERVEFVSVFGGDGRMHAVPVPWLEYIPISKDSSMQIDKFEQKNESLSGVCYHGLVAKKIEY